MTLSDRHVTERQAEDSQWRSTLHTFTHDTPRHRGVRCRSRPSRLASRHPPPPEVAMAVSPAPLANAMGTLPTGQHVQVRCRFDGSWVDGFEVFDTVDDGYRVLRAADGQVLPDSFSPREI